MMKFSLNYHPSAQKEYLDSVSWYEQAKTGLGEQFIQELEAMLDKIEQNPFLFQVKRKRLREGKLRSFPYIIVYTVNSRKKEILILAVFHTSRNPFLKGKR